MAPNSPLNRTAQRRGGWVPSAICAAAAGLRHRVRSSNAHTEEGRHENP